MFAPLLALFYGTAGTPAVVIGSLAPAQLAVPGLGGGLVWLDPGLLVDVATLVAAGQDAPAVKAYPLPADPTLAGTVVLFQGALFATAEPPVLTNVSNVVLRF